MLEFLSSAGGGGLLGSGLEAGGGLLSSIMGNNQAQQNAQNQFFYNFALQQQQQAYQTQMANTQYQRSVADMKQAGLNPMLAAGGGMSLDAAPSGASASVGQAQTIAPNFSGIGNTAIQGAKLLKELSKIDQDIKTGEAVAAKTQRDTRAPGQTKDLTQAEIDRTNAQGDLNWHQSKGQLQTNRGEAGDASISIGGQTIRGPIQALDRIKRMVTGEDSPDSSSVPHSAKAAKATPDPLQALRDTLPGYVAKNYDSSGRKYRNFQ